MLSTSRIKLDRVLCQVIASQRQLEAKYSQAKDTADQWYRRAQLALEKGDETLAREALSRRKAYEVCCDYISQTCLQVCLHVIGAPHASRPLNLCYHAGAVLQSARNSAHCGVFAVSAKWFCIYSRLL